MTARVARLPRINQVRLRTAVTAMLVFGLLASGAEAGPKRGGPHRYSPKHGHCKRNYRRVKHRHKVLCIKRRHKRPASKPKADEKVKLHAHLDPTYTRDPLNPFKVTYAYSASATQEAVAASASSETPAPLPSGVLTFYSDGKLECAINVGGAIDSSACPVTYTALGDHRVTTIYSSGEQSATETEIEHIDPLVTTTSLDASFQDFPPHEVKPGQWQVGVLSISGQSHPVGTPTLTCSGGVEPGCIETGAQFTSGPATLPIFTRIGGFEGNKPILEIVNPATGMEGTLLPVSTFESGALHLRAMTNPGAGYLSSSALAAIQFTPHWLPGFYHAEVEPTTVTDEFEPFVMVGSYLKHGSATILTVKSAIEENLNDNECIFQLRVHGQPAFAGDPGKEGGGTGVGTQMSREFSELPAGPTVVEVWVRYAGSGTPTCKIGESVFTVSE